MSQFKKSLMNALQLTITHIETEDFLRGRLGKTPTDKTACEDPDMAQCTFELVNEAARQRLRVKEQSWSCHFENVAKRFIKPGLGDIGQQVHGVGIGDLANTRVRE